MTEEVAATVTTDILTASTELITEEGLEVISNTISSPLAEQYYTSNDWCKLLFQDGYLKVLKHLALSGELQRSNIRAICWKIFLGCLPENQSQWVEFSNKSRAIYKSLKQTYMVDPHTDVESTLDLNIHNPLSLDDESPWNQFFQDGELKQTITQDIVRTHPDQQFFRQQEIQNSMLDILFCYAKEHPDLGYRQGMHELLAPLLFVLHAECRDDVHSDDTLSLELKVVMDPEYIEADAFALFSELMEGMQNFYLSASLEADLHKAREQRANGQSGNAMKLDPRVALPFESKDFVAPTSAIARKLDYIHDLLLKRADEQLYYRLQDLGIPPQTYGIRWIRLLFGREFYLPSVLQLWDALFAEGVSLALMDYIFVVMLIQIRDTLLTDDYGTCMQLLMKYPTIYEVSDLVQKALHLKNPTLYPNPVPYVREWTQFNNVPVRVSNQLHVQEQPSPEGMKKSQRIAHKTRSVIVSAKKQMHIPTKPINLPTKLSLSKFGESRSSSHPKADTPGTTVNIIEQAKVDEQEMIKNPKTRPRALSEIDRIKEQLENSEAKCLYCGRKMESILDELQLQVEELEMPENNETPMYLAIAGLKQIRDLLLHKLPFSGELPDYETLTTPPPDKQTFVESEDVDHPLVTTEEQDWKDPLSN